MPTTEHPPCPLCAATRLPLALFIRRTKPFDTPCLCEGTLHRVLVNHPHVPEGCAGYAWQSLPLQQEVR